ncbi:MAG: hypothetical protein ACOYN0_03835 [Phycisphaerales bacterium]
MIPLLGGCVMSGDEASARSGDAYPFAAATMRIHPLTQVDAEPKLPDGTVDKLPRIIVHLEFKDRFGDTVKALGTFYAELYKSVGGSLPGMDQKVMDWTEEAFLDAAKNTGRFDPATRTYRVQLTGPEWLKEWKAEGKSGPAGWLKLRVVYTTTDATGEQLVLEDSLQLQR